MKKIFFLLLIPVVSFGQTYEDIISIVSENCDVPNNTEQGFVYSTEIQPTLEDTQVNVNGTNITTTIEGLEPNTTYYVRAFLTNNFGDFYSDEVSFSTEELDLTPPVITIIGDNPLEINIGEDYTEFGATGTYFVTVTTKGSKQTNTYKIIKK